MSTPADWATLLPWLLDYVLAHREILLLAPLGFAGAFIYGITGFGSALVTIPIGSMFVPLPFTLAVWAVVDLFTAMRIGLQNPRLAVAGEWMRMVPMVLLGIAIGVTLLVQLPRDAVMFALGCFALLYAGYSLLRRSAPGVIDRRWAYAAGLTGGITGTMFGAGGPPYAIYLSLRGLSKEQYRATLTMTSIFSISLRLTAFTFTGVMLQEGLWLGVLVVLPAAWLGLRVASRVFQRISRELVMRCVSLALLATGVSLIWRAL